MASPEPEPCAQAEVKLMTQGGDGSPARELYTDCFPGPSSQVGMQQMALSAHESFPRKGQRDSRETHGGPYDEDSRKAIDKERGI